MSEKLAHKRALLGGKRAKNKNVRKVQKACESTKRVKSRRRVKNMRSERGKVWKKVRKT